MHFHMYLIWLYLNHLEKPLNDSTDGEWLDWDVCSFMYYGSPLKGKCDGNGLNKIGLICKNKIQKTNT